MPDGGPAAPADVDRWIVFDVHKDPLVAGVPPATGGSPGVSRPEDTGRAIRRFIERAGDPSTPAVAYEAGPCGHEIYRLPGTTGVACDVIAPSPDPIRAGDRVKTDRRDAKRPVRLHRAGELGSVSPPTPRQEGLRDLVRRRDDLRCARTAARHRVGKALLRHGHVHRVGKHAWTIEHRGWPDRRRLSDPPARLALDQVRAHPDGLDAQPAALDHESAQIAQADPRADPVARPCSFRGVATRTAPGLLAGIGDFRRLAHPREPMSHLGPVPGGYPSGDQQHRGHITETGDRHARRLMVEAARHHRHRPHLPRRTAATREHVPPRVPARARQAQPRLHHRHRSLTSHGERPTVADVAVAREPCGFIRAAMTDQPLREEAAAA